MTVMFPSNTATSSYFVPAICALLVSIVMSAIYVKLPDPIGSVSFLLLPLLIVTLWPSRCNAVVTIATFLFMGILMDWGTNGALGQWALTYLVVFAVLRPDRRDNYVNFFGAMGMWCIGLLIGVIMLVVTGWVVYATWPNFIILFKQACLVSILMPLIIALRNLVRMMLTDPHDRPL